MAATALPPQGPRHPAPGPYGGPHAEDPHQHTRPFFYVQPAQPFLPYQWPMPYNPYCGFPGMGYGMVVPPFPPSPYVDAPGYIMPHTQLHLVDYRRMVNPHMAPTVAYQARRFRYQHTTNPRVMINSEVQTEPTLGQDQTPAYSTSDGPNGLTNSESGRGTCCTGSASTSSSSSTEERNPKRLESVVTAMSPQPTNTTIVGPAPPRATIIQDHILFQAEEVQIKCSETVADLKITHCKETTKLVSDINGGLVHCTAGAPGLLADGSVQNLSPLPQQEERTKDDMSDPATYEAAYSEEPCLPPCPDILLIGASPSTGPGESLPPEGSAEKADALNAVAVNAALTDQAENVIADVGSPVVTCEEMVPKDESNIDAYDFFPSSKNPEFKILHLPFDLQLGGVQHLETSVWSVESLMPYVPNTEWLVQNGLMTPQKEPLSPVMENPRSPPLVAGADSLQGRQQFVMEVEPDPHESMTSLESLPPYLPSASWLADFGNVYLYHKIQPNARQQLSIHGNLLLDKPSQDVKGGQHVSQSSDAPPSRHREEHTRPRRKTGAASDVSDHECQAISSQGEGLPSPSSQGRCICNRSLIKRGAAASTSPTPSMKRHKLPHPQQDAKSPALGTCKCMPGRSKSSTKGSGSDAPARPNEEEDTTEGETSENSVHLLTGSKRASRKAQHFSRHSEKCPVAQRPKLREQNCSCDMPKCTHVFSGAREGNGHIWQNDSGWRRREVDPVMSSTERHRAVEQRGVVLKCQAATLRRSLTYDSEPFKGLNNQKKPYSQSQGSHRKVTRC